MSEPIPKAVQVAAEAKTSRWALGRWMATRRADLGLSQRAFANLIGQPPSVVQNIESGQRSMPEAHIGAYARGLMTNEAELREMVAVTRKGLTFASNINPDLVGLFFWYLAHRPVTDAVMEGFLEQMGVDL